MRPCIRASRRDWSAGSQASDGTSWGSNLAGVSLRILHQVYGLESSFDRGTGALSLD